MAILFDWYENPKTKDKQGEELTLHPRIKLNGSTTTDELRRHIQEYCSLTETDVLAVLDALSHFVGRELGEQGFALPDVAEFEKLINDRTRGILICNPNNPTGYLYTRNEMNRIRDLVKKYDLFLFSDEVYREFIYTGSPYISACHLEGIEQNVVLIDSVSKRYSECGIRIGNRFSDCS